MTEIYLIRHTQAEGNLYRVMQGQWDGGVTALGLKQIDALAERFKDVKIDALYSSDLYRTRKTASAITRYHDIPLIPEPMLREVNIGPWEARFFADISHETPELLHNFIFDPENWYLEGAETYAQVAERAYAALERIVRENEGKSVALVSHGVTIRCLMAKISGISLKDTDNLPICGNTAVTRLFWEDGRFTVDYYNDTSHLLSLNLKSWGRTPEMRAEVLDPIKEADYYKACYADSWLAAHGSLKGYNENVYLDRAIEQHMADKNALLKIYYKEEEAGLVHMDSRRGAHAGYGWISLLYLKEQFRGKGCGVQLLGRAMFYFRALGRKSLRLNVAEDNTAAVAFYQKFGFRELSRETNALGSLLLMELSLEDKSNA